MRILAIDTSTKIGALALTDDARLLAEAQVTVTKGHAGYLLPTLDHLLNQVGWTPEDIELLACAVGPGSFAALRVGISTAKGFAFPGNIKMVSVNTLQAMALPFGFHDGRIFPILDAKKKQVYAAIFEGDGKGGIARVTEDLVLDPGQLAEKLAPGDLLLGDGAGLYRSIFDDKVPSALLYVPPQLCYHRGGSVALLGLEAASADEFTENLTPNYIREPDAIPGKTFIERRNDGDR